MEKNITEIKHASYAAVASLLNLTVLPVIGFVVLLFVYKKTSVESFSRYHAVIGIKLSVAAGIALLLVSLLIIAAGGFSSPMSWIYALCYFLSVHAFFILCASWVLVRAWSGERMK